MTDFELAKAFFTRLKERGFHVELRDYSSRLESDPDFTPENGVAFELFSSEGKPFCSFDFSGTGEGRFYRISGFTSGFWQDEVDWKKY
jgi:hypothetical protein